MRFANVRELKLETNKVLELSRKNGPIVVTRRGQPIALLRTISENDLSFKTTRLWERLKVAAERSGYGPGDIEKLIKHSRPPKR